MTTSAAAPKTSAQTFQLNSRALRQLLRGVDAMVSSSFSNSRSSAPGCPHQAGLLTSFTGGGGVSAQTPRRCTALATPSGARPTAWTAALAVQPAAAVARDWAKARVGFGKCSRRGPLRPRRNTEGQMPIIPRRASRPSASTSSASPEPIYANRHRTSSPGPLALPASPTARSSWSRQQLRRKDPGRLSRGAVYACRRTRADARRARTQAE